MGQEHVGLAQEEHSGRSQREVQPGKDAGLRLRIEIHQCVAARQ